VPAGTITEGGLRMNINVGIQYLEAWLRGNGCVPLYNLMEDAATAEISRAQLWQWRKHGASITGGPKIDDALLKRLFDEEMDKMRLEVGEEAWTRGKHEAARKLFWQMTVAKEFEEFLTLPAYEIITKAAFKGAKKVAEAKPAPVAKKPAVAAKKPVAAARIRIAGKLTLKAKPKKPTAKAPARKPASATRKAKPPAKKPSSAGKAKRR